MLGCETRRIACRTYTGIFKTFCDSNNTSNFNQKYMIRNNRAAFITWDFRSSERRCIHTQGLTKNFKYYPAAGKPACTLNKPQIRWSSSNQANDLPLLTSSPQETWPGFFSPMSNLLITFLVIKPYVDSSFDLIEFLGTSKKVAEIVSQKLANEEIDDLAEMVTTNVLQEIRNNLPRFSSAQRQELVTKSDDIYFSTISTIELNNDHQGGKKYLHVNTIHHTMKGLKEISSKLEKFSIFNMPQPNQNSADNFEISEDRSHVLNYKFSREYSSDGPGDWLLSGVNHYRSSKALKWSF